MALTVKDRLQALLDGKTLVRPTDAFKSDPVQLSDLRTKDEESIAIFQDHIVWEIVEQEDRYYKADKLTP